MANALLIKNANLYAPEPKGLCDILAVNGSIIEISTNIEAGLLSLPNLLVIDVSGKKVIPGYVDQHVHIIGGGGESGPYSRTPEVMLSDITTVGITTVVGVLGTDGTSRSTEALLAKARALETEGISAYILTGSYELPLHTITEDARKDIIIIDKVIGVGEIALSDHRSSQPTKDELKRVITQARVGGMLAGKSGVVQFHMGSGKAGITMLLDILDETEVPAKHFIPTHINRADALFEQAKELAKRGGYVDITSGVRESDGFTDCIKPSEAILNFWKNNEAIDFLTMSSDGNGCMSVHLPDGTSKELVAQLVSLHEEVRDAIIAGVPIEVAVSVCSKNPAKANGLYPRKGCLQVDSDADMVILDEDLLVDTVIANGKLMIKNKEVIVKGTFEK